MQMTGCQNPRKPTNCPFLLLLSCKSFAEKVNFPGFLSQPVHADLSHCSQFYTRVLFPPGFAEVDEESNYAAAERSLKQALHQLTHLQKVWQGVLPAAVYRKAIGTYIYTADLSFLNQKAVMGVIFHVMFEKVCHDVLPAAIYHKAVGTYI